MRIWRASIVLAAALTLVGAACASDDDEGTFDVTGRVVTVEPSARPANDPDESNIIGAIVVQTDEPEECENDPNGVRVYVDEDTDFTPTSAATDLKRLRGQTVNVSGSTTTDGDTCTPIADSVAATNASGSPGGSGETGGTGGTAGSPSATSSPKATNDPDDEGSITDTEETASPAPENPDEHGVVNDSGKG